MMLLKNWRIDYDYPKKETNQLMFASKPHKIDSIWQDNNGCCKCLELPKGSIKKLIGRELSWNDEPVELKEE